MALSWKEGGIPQFRPPPRLPGAPIPPIPNPMTKLNALLIKLAIKKEEILEGIEEKKQELIAIAKREVKAAIRAALGIIKTPAEDIIKKKKEDIARAKKRLDSILEKKRKLEEKIAKALALYEKYKNLDDVLKKEAMRLINIEIDRQKVKLEEEFAEQKKKVTDNIKLRAEALKASLGLGKGKIIKIKQKIESAKKKIETIKKMYDDLKKLLDEILEIKRKIEYWIAHADEEAIKLAIKYAKPPLMKKLEKLEKKVEPKKKEIEKKLDDIKKKIQLILKPPFNLEGAITYNAFSAGVTMYWVGAIINPAPGAPNGIIVTNPGAPIASWNPKFDLPSQSDDPAEALRELIPMIKMHLTTLSGLYLLPTGTPPFTPLPWVGYGSTINWEMMFVQPIKMSLGKDSLGNLLADNYDRAIKTGFPNAPCIPIPYTTGVAQKIKSLTAISDIKSMVGVIKGLLYQIPVYPIEKATAELLKKQKELQEKYIEPVLEEKRKLEKFKEKILEYKRKIEEYMKLVQEYADWAAEQKAAVEYWSDPANITAGVVSQVNTTLTNPSNGTS